jgi:F-box/WD-40 domain protein 2
MFVVASDDLTLRVWDLSLGRCVKVISAACCSDLQHDSNIIVASFHTAYAAAWNIESGMQIQAYKGHTSAVLSVDFDYEAGLVATGSADMTVKLWDLHEGLCLKTLTGHMHWIRKVVFRRAAVNSIVHRVGDLVLLTSDQMSLKVWSPDVVANGACIETAVLRDGNRFKGPVMFDGWTITCPLQNKSSLLQVTFSTLELKGSE